MRVLVLAGDSEVQSSIIQAMSAGFWECEFVAVGSKYQLLSALAADDLALVITDYRLGWMDGLQVIRQVRQQRPAVPVIMATAQDDVEIVAAAFKAGASDYLPLHRLDKLSAAVGELLAVADLSRAASFGMQENSGPQREVCISTLIDTTRAILSERDFAKATRLVLEACKHVLGATTGYIGLLAAEQDHIDIICLDEDPYACSLTANAQMRICGSLEEAFRQRKAVYTNDVQRSGWWNANDMPDDLHQVLCVPLMLEGEVVGFLELANPREGFSDEAALIATLFGDLAMLSLQQIQVGDSLSIREAQFSRFSKASPGGIILTDREGRIVEWNEAEERVSGLSRAEVVGQYIWDELFALAPHSDRTAENGEAFKQHVVQGLATGELASEFSQGEHTIVRRDGEMRRIRYTLFPTPLRTGYGIGSITWDITEESAARRRAIDLAEELQRERDILSITMANTKTHLVYLDNEFRFLNVNAAYAQASGYTRDQLLGRKHFDLFPNAENQLIFERVRDTGIPLSIDAKPFVFDNQPERGVTYWDWSLTPILAGDGKTVGLVFSLTDVTVQQRSALQMEHHLDQMSQLVDIAQEILSERTLEGLLERSADAARRITGAGQGYAIHGHESSTYRWVLADSQGIRAREHVVSGEGRLAWQRLGSERPVSLDLNDVTLRAYLGYLALPEMVPENQEMVGARLIGHHGDTCAIIFAPVPSEGTLETASASILVQLAGMASLALQHIEAHIETQHRVAELNTTISSIADGVVIYGLRGEILRMNEAARGLAEHVDAGSGGARAASQSLLLSPQHGAVTESCAFLADNALMRLALEGQTTHGHVTELRHPHTDDISWVAVSAAPIWGDDELRVGVVEVLTDITQLRSVQNQFEEANSQLAQQSEHLRQKAEELVARNRDLRLLSAVGRDLNTTLDLGEVLDRVLEATQQVNPVNTVVIWLVDQDQPEWLVRHALSSLIGTQVAGRVRIWGEQGVLGSAAVSDGDKAEPVPTYRIISFDGDEPQAVLVVPLWTGGKLIGAIEVRDQETGRLGPDATALLATLASWAAIAIENALLHRDAQRAAVAMERNRLAGELHDAVSQLLFSAKVTAESLTRLWDINPEAVRSGLLQLKSLTEGALAEMRMLLLELRPSALVETEMAELLRQLVQAVSGRSKLSVELEVNDGGQLPEEVKIALYRIAQESLNNVMKHARADRAGIVMQRSEDQMSLVIWDNGRGFDVLNVPSASLGQKILRERAASIGASIDIDSAPGRGTRVTVTWRG